MDRHQFNCIWLGAIADLGRDTVILSRTFAGLSHVPGPGETFSATSLAGVVWQIRRETKASDRFCFGFEADSRGAREKTHATGVTLGSEQGCRF